MKPTDPWYARGDDEYRTDGANARTVIAAMAMQGMLADSHPHSQGVPFTTMAERAVNVANALLAELAKEDR